MNFDALIQDKGVQTAGLIVVSVFLFFTLAEFIYSQWKKQGYSSISDLIINATIALLQQLTDVFNKLIFIIGYVYVLDHFSIQQLLHVPGIPFGYPITLTEAFPYLQFHPVHILVWVGILLLADFCQYWLHRLSHEVNILWAGHIVHHSMEAYNYAVALRQSFIESIYTWIFYLPLAILGVPWQLFIMAYSISLVWQFFVHTRYIDKLGWLEIMFSTPSHHRVHHGKNDRYIDRNYGALLIIWDKWFGTFEPETEPVEYGIRSRLETNNPFWANIHHHVRIGKLWLQTGKPANRFRVIFGRPAYIPDDCRIEVQEYTPVSGIPRIKKMYILFNFLLIAVFSVNQVFQFEATHDILPFAASVILILISHLVNIALLENRPWADKAEVARLVFLALCGIVMNSFLGSGQGFILTIAALILLGFSFGIAKDHRRRELASDITR